MKGCNIWPDSRMARAASQKPATASKPVGPATVEDGKIEVITGTVKWVEPCGGNTKWKTQFSLWNDVMLRKLVTENEVFADILWKHRGNVAVTIERTGRKWLVRKVESVPPEPGKGV